MSSIAIHPTVHKTPSNHCDQMKELFEIIASLANTLATVRIFDMTAARKEIESAFAKESFLQKCQGAVTFVTAFGSTFTGLYTAALPEGPEQKMFDVMFKSSSAFQQVIGVLFAPSLTDASARKTLALQVKLPHVQETSASYQKGIEAVLQAEQTLIGKDHLRGA